MKVQNKVILVSGSGNGMGSEVLSTHVVDITDRDAEMALPEQVIAGHGAIREVAIAFSLDPMQF